MPVATKDLGHQRNAKNNNLNLIWTWIRKNLEEKLVSVDNPFLFPFLVFGNQPRPFEEESLTRPSKIVHLPFFLSFFLSYICPNLCLPFLLIENNVYCILYVHLFPHGTKWKWLFLLCSPLLFSILCFPFSLVENSDVLIFYCILYVHLFPVVRNGKGCLYYLLHCPFLLTSVADTT